MSDSARSDHGRPGLLQRLLGDRPGAVIFRLVLLSLVVGFLMSVFGINVQHLVRGVVQLFRDTMRDGTAMLGSLAGYMVTGAALVVPVWLLLRLTRGR